MGRKNKSEVAAPETWKLLGNLRFSLCPHQMHLGRKNLEVSRKPWETIGNYSYLSSTSEAKTKGSNNPSVANRERKWKLWETIGIPCVFSYAGLMQRYMAGAPVDPMVPTWRILKKFREP